METTELLALLASGVAAACAVAYLGLSLIAAVEARQKLWAHTRATTPGKLAAINRFMRLSLLEVARPLSSIQKLLRTVKQNLAQAGYGGSADEFVMQLLWQGVLVAIIGSLLMTLLISPLPGLFLGIASGALWALWIRPALLDADATKRSRAIYRRIPYALDLSVLVLETGGTLRDGLEEISLQDDPLAEELRIALLEMDSGAPQAAALRNMGERVGLESLETILMAINRGEETGAPMVNTLITQADMFRERRLQQIEKLAVEAPTKMTFPNMMIMVSVLLLIVGPLLIQLVSSGLF